MITYIIAIIAVAELVVGLTVLRNVRGMVERARQQIQESVREGIEEAKNETVEKLTSSIGPMLIGLAREVPNVIREVIDSKVRVTAGGTVQVLAEDEQAQLKEVTDVG